MSVSTILSVRAIADPVRARVRGRGTVLGGGLRACYIDFDGWVVAVTGSSVPAMPNGISLAGPAAPEWRTGEVVRIDNSWLVGRGAAVDLSGAAGWNPVSPQNGDRSSDDVRRRCDAMLDASRETPSIAGLSQLVRSLRDRDHQAFEAAVGNLVGRGGGLTPEGDDVLAATAAALWSFGAPAGLPAQARSGWLDSLCPRDLRRRTTSLSATLIELAVSGNVVEPLQTLMDLDRPEEQWRPAITRLMIVGHSTGRTWVLGSARAGAAMAGN